VHAGPYALPRARTVCMASRACRTSATAQHGPPRARRLARSGGPVTVCTAVPVSVWHAARTTGPFTRPRTRTVCTASRACHTRTVTPRGPPRARRLTRLGGPVTVCTAVPVSVSSRVVRRTSDRVHCGSLGGALGVRRAGDSGHRGSLGPHAWARVPTRAKRAVWPRPVLPQPQADGATGGAGRPSARAP